MRPGPTALHRTAVMFGTNIERQLLYSCVPGKASFLAGAYLHWMICIVT